MLYCAIANGTCLLTWGNWIKYARETFRGLGVRDADARCTAIAADKIYPSIRVVQNNLTEFDSTGRGKWLLDVRVEGVILHTTGQIPHRKSLCAHKFVQNIRTK